ncbi:MAG: CPBP family intramembrane glutamic endopeptidase [Actinomycetota bacterium]
MIGRARRQWSVRDAAVREARRCRGELAAIRSAGPSISPTAALGWSVAAVLWGNGLVAVGRRVGHDQWITLVGVPLFGAAGWWWLQRRGCTRRAIGLRWPRPDLPRPLVILTGAAAVVAGVLTAAGLATAGQDRRGLRTVRTVVGTAFGEELVHRGVLLTVWAMSGASTGTTVAANAVVFGLWHATGADHAGEVAGPALAALTLVWLRLRSRSILVPAVFHAATNLGGVFSAREAFPAGPTG